MALFQVVTWLVTILECCKALILARADSGMLTNMGHDSFHWTSLAVVTEIQEDAVAMDHFFISA